MDISIFYKNDSLYSNVKRQYKSSILLDELISIGFSEIVVSTKNSSSSKINNYEQNFYENYSIIMSYINKIYENLSEIDLNPNITQITVSCIYGKYRNNEKSVEKINDKNNEKNGTDKSTEKSPDKINPQHFNSRENFIVDICALFNLHTISKEINQVQLQSKLLDNKVYSRFLDNTYKKIYAKTSRTAINVFKGIINLYNTLVLYVSQNIAPGIDIRNIAINENTCVSFSITCSLNEDRKSVV
jgi:hypothetical protein